MFLVSAVLTTCVTGVDAAAALADVRATIGEDPTFGKPGWMLPFTVDRLSARAITDEEIGRGYDGPPVTSDDAEVVWP